MSTPEAAAALLNDTSTLASAPLPVTLTDPTPTNPTPSLLNSTAGRGWKGVECGGGGHGAMSGSLGCNVAMRAESLCRRLAPPPVPPWLRTQDSSRRLLQRMISRCPSWTVYQERCHSGSGNATWDYPSGEEEGRGEESSDEGVRWVIPVLAVTVAMLLLLLLAFALYKYYTRAQERSKYRVAGAGGYRFKPSHSGSSWTGGPLTGSNTSESYLSQSVASSTAPAYRYARPPVCRLLEQAQYAATPTEDDSRPRPPAFTSPAYFLPSLSWLRFPALRQAWPGEGGDADRGSAAYTAAGLSQCHCDQTVHRWLENEERLTESGPASDHEYSEIWDGPPQYSSLTQTPCLPSSGGIGPYEYEMQEAVSRRAVCECERPFDPPHRSRSGQWAGQRHGYDKLWQCGEGSERVYSPESCASSLGHSENGWLSRYRLPTPCTPITDQDPDPEGGAGHIHRPHRPHPTKCWEGGRPGPTMGRNGEARVGQGSIPDSDFLPCQRPLRDYNSLSASVWEPDQDRRVEGRSQVKYVNPVFEGQGSEAACVPGSSPLLSRLWGYVGLNHKS